MVKVGFVMRGAGIAVDEAIFECSVDEDRQLAGRRGDRFGLAHAEGQAAIEGAEGGLSAA